MRRRRGSCVAPASQCSWPPTKLTATGTNLMRLPCGRWGLVSRTRSAPCTAGAWAICSTRWSARCRRWPRRQRPRGGRGGGRSVVHEVAGTTVDPVDSLIEMDGKVWRFVDTAGLRRKVGQASGHEYYASVRTHGAIDAAEVVIVLIDGSVPLTEQDQRVLSMVIEAGRALVLAFNKWDLVDDERRYQLDNEIDRQLAQVQWAQ